MLSPCFIGAFYKLGIKERLKHESSIRISRADKGH